MSEPCGWTIDAFIGAKLIRETKQLHYLLVYECIFCKQS